MSSPGDSLPRFGSDAETAAWITSAEAYLSGPPPSLTFTPTSANSSTPAAEAAAPAAEAAAPAPLSIAASKALAGAAAVPPPQRKVLEGLILLWHGHWDAAHAVAQSHEGQSDHDFLHAIGHRREGDYPNADYWFGSAGRHPVFAALSRAASISMPEGHPLRPVLLPGGRWSTKAFTAEVRRAAQGGSPHAEALIALQALEMRLLAGCLLAG